VKPTELKGSHLSYSLFLIQIIYIFKCGIVTRFWLYRLSLSRHNEVLSAFQLAWEEELVPVSPEQVLVQLGLSLIAPHLLENRRFR
jgi:hypothetical protein